MTKAIFTFMTRNALVPFATDATINSYLGLTNIGSSGGIAYQPAICGSQAYRTAVVKSYSDQTTGEVKLCHISLQMYSKSVIWQPSLLEAVISDSWFNV